MLYVPYDIRGILNAKGDLSLTDSKQALYKSDPRVAETKSYSKTCQTKTQTPYLPEEEGGPLYYFEEIL